MAVLIKKINRNFIPDMVHPLSKGRLQQPNREDLTIDDESVIMNTKSFKMLAEYSTSVPSGVYEGKMWKAHKYKEIDGEKVWDWYLLWFGLSEKEGMCSNQMRKIIIID